MSKHTPGPWKIVERKNKNGSTLAPVITGPYDFGSKAYGQLAIITSRSEMEANAHLIAAAPAMLEALKSLVAGIDLWNEEIEKIIGRVVDYDWNALEAARSIISAVEGKE